jgi:predicted  nucleic acid-binding Zn-ribbon protein
MLRDVDPRTLERLLDLQAEDSAIRLLEHRRDELPAARRLAELNDQLSELDADIDIASRQRTDVEREQSRLQGEIELLEQKIEREEGRLFSGGVSNPKELSALQAEVASLRSRRAAREDDLLEIMVRADQAEETMQKLRVEREAVAREAAELSAAVDVELGRMGSELEDHNERRTSARADIPADILSLYERIRASRNGIGAAALVGGACQGCHTKLPAREVERMRAEGGLQRCDNCRRILVVTPE